MKQAHRKKLSRSMKKYWAEKKSNKPKFKVGELIVAKRGFGNITKGTAYRVNEHPYSSKYICIYDDRGTWHSFSRPFADKYFKLATSRKIKASPSEMKNLKRSRAMKESWARRKARTKKIKSLEDIFGIAGSANLPLKTSEDLEKAIKESREDRVTERYLIPVPILPVTDVVDKGTSCWVFFIVGLISFIVGALFF